MGTILSVISFLMVIGYTVQKFDILITRKDVDIALSVRDTFFGDDYTFKGSQGFNIAVALTGFDEVRESILSPDYANIKFEYSEWDILESGTIIDRVFYIESHPCSERELGLTGNHSSFQPIHETSTAYVNLYKHKFVCLDQEDLEIQGTFSSKKAKLLRATLNRCSGHDYCKSQEEINEYLENKYLLLLINQIRFDSERYGEESIVPESRVDWIRVSTKIQFEQPYSVKKTRLQLQDLHIDLDQLTELEDSSIFKFEKLPPQIINNRQEVMQMVSFEMNMDMDSVVRLSYTFIDMMSDIGGIQSIIFTTFALFLSVLNHNYFDSYMAQKLYKLEKLQHRRPEQAEPEFLSPSRLANSLEFLIDSLPEKCVCCRKSRHQKGLDKAREALAKEVDIIKMIKSRRYFHMAFRYLLPKEVRLDLKRFSHYVVIDPDQEEVEQQKLMRMSTC